MAQANEQFDRPGQPPEHAEDAIHRVPGMLGPDERKLLFSLTCHRYSGLGAIIDAGAFLGASTFALAAGLLCNPRSIAAVAPIHSYDQFVISDPTYARFLKNHVGKDLSAGQRFITIYLANIRAHRKRVVVHDNDFLDETWFGWPVEILFADICKSHRLNGHLMRLFFPYLVPDRSVIIQQDYHHPHLPWIHITLEYLRDSFVVANEVVDDSIVLDYVRPVEPEKLEKSAEFSFSNAEKVELMDRAIARLQPDNRGSLVLARVVLLLKLEGRAAAERAFADATSCYADSGLATWKSIYVKQVAARIEKAPRR